MKRFFFPRMVGLIFLYLGIFVALVMIQFTKQRGFIRHIGDMTVSGQYGESPIRTADVGGEAPGADYPLAGDITVSFGGMEFLLHDGGKFSFLRYAGGMDSILPQTMSVYGSSASFGFAGGTRLIFDALNAGDSGEPELRITGQFGEEYAGLELPYRFQRTSRIRDAGGGQFIVMAEGISYRFDSSRLNSDRKVVILNTDEAIAYYRAVPEPPVVEQKEIAFDDFILPAARNEVLYNEAVNHWRDEAYSLWSRSVRTTDNEALIAAYVGESIGRGVYQEAMAGIPSAFLRRASWTYTSSVYLGRLDIGLRSLSSFDRDAVARLSSLIAAGSKDFFLESHAVEFCGLRGYDQILDGIAELARSLDPASLSPDLIPGILESYTEWGIYRSPDNNPFEGLVASACQILYDGIKENAAGNRVLYFDGSRADTEYNFRLGLALDRYGRSSGREEWGALGRSLVISILSLTENGSFPAGFAISEEETGGNPKVLDADLIPDRARVDFLTLYRLFPGPTYPHAVRIGVLAGNVWAWTASDSVTVSQKNNIVDIAVSFPVGETHYMLIRGLRPFVKIQIYGIDYRTDPRFEYYDAAGWTFSSSEQTLLLKL
ncbi:MAG: hypothetical protein LBP81_02795, partial [Treponema sp.]|nr:hypothetical protein [Treponema sp.]